MSSDEYNYPPDAPYRAPGVGFFIGRRCDKCSNSLSGGGFKWKKVLRICPDCRNKLQQKESITQPA